jgi:TPR repeat protein
MKYSNVMKLVVLGFALALTACGGGSHRASHPSHPPLAPLDQARAYENGEGVARDYAEAAKIYKQQCASGSGPIVACRKLTKALLAGRGADRDMQGAFDLARTLCDTRNDAQSCVLVVFSMMRAGEEEEDSSPSEKLVSTLKAYLALRCDKRHLERCELPRDPFNWLDHSSSGERADHEFDDQGCKLGVLEACERFRFDPGARAFATVLAACRKGDADACVAAGQPIDAAILC